MFSDFGFVLGTMLVIYIGFKLNSFVNFVVKNFEKQSRKTSDMVPKMRPEASEEVVWESRFGIYRSVFSHRGSQTALDVHFGVPRINFGTPFGGGIPPSTAGNLRYVTHRSFLWSDSTITLLEGDNLHTME